MSRWGKNIVVPLDSLCKEKENTNRPTVARSVGTVGKWGKMGFTSTRTYTLSALHPMAAAAAAAAAAASPAQSPASTHDHDPNDLSVSVPEPPKPKKFFKSRNAAPPEVIAQIIQQMPHCVATSPMRDQHAAPAAAHETLKQKLAKGNSAERKRKSPKKKAAATPVTPSTPGAFGLDRDDDLDAPGEHLEGGDEPRSTTKKKRPKEEKKLKPEAPPSRILGRARKAVNYREVDEDDRYPTPTKDLIIPKSQRTPAETVTSASASALALAAATSTEASITSTAANSPDSGPALPPPTTVPSAAACASATTTLPLPTSASATNPTSASRTPEHPPIVLRISKGTSRLVSTDSEEPPSSSPAHHQYQQHQQQQQQQLLQQHQQHHLQYQNQQQQQQHLEDPFGIAENSSGTAVGASGGVDRRDDEREKVPANTPKIIVKPLRPPGAEEEQQQRQTEEPDEDADEEEEEEEEEEPPEINYCTVKISPDKPPKERLKLIIKTDVIRNAIAKAAAAAAAKAAGEETRSEKKSKSKKHKHLKHAQLEQQLLTSANNIASGGTVHSAIVTSSATATATATVVTADSANSEFKTPSPHLALNEPMQQPIQPQRGSVISPTTRSDHDFDSQSSVLGSVSSKGNSTPLLLAQAVQEDSCVIRSRGSSVITSDLESSQHSSLVAPPSDIESRLESMMMTIDGGSATVGTSLSDVAPGPLQEDILAVLRGDVTRVNGGGGEEPPAMEEPPPKRTTRGRARKANNNVDAAPVVSAPAVTETRTRGRAKAAETVTSAVAVAAPKRTTRGTRGAKKAELEMNMEVDESGALAGNDQEDATATVTTSGLPPRRGRNAAARANNNNLASINNNINKIAANLSAKAEASRLAEGGPATGARSYGRKRKNQQVTQVMLPQEAETSGEAAAAAMDAAAAAAQREEEDEEEQPTPAKIPHTEPEFDHDDADGDVDADADHDLEPDPDPDLDEADSNSNSNNSSLQHDGSSSSPPPRDFKFKDKFKRTLTLDTQLAHANAEAAAAAAAAAAEAEAAGIMVATTSEGCSSSTVTSLAAPAETEQRSAVKLVISKKKGSIFKSRALVPSDQAEQAAVAKRHLYKHSWDAALEANGGGTGSDASNASAPGGVSSTGGKDHMLHMHLLATKSDADFCDSPSSNNNTSSGSCSSSTLRDDSPNMGLGLGLGKVSRSTAKQISMPVTHAHAHAHAHAHTMVEGFDMDAAEVEELGLERVVGLSSVANLVGSSSSGSGSGPMRVDRKTKEYYTVVRNVKTAHQIQEIGEYQEMDDDVEYILDALQPHNPPATRCLSALQLATKCMMPAFRMHVRAHGVVTKFFKALSDANRDLSLGLCTSAIMYILSQEGLNMDLDRDSLELMINLLEADGVGMGGAAPSDQRANYERNKQKVRELCEEIKAQGKGTHLNVESITVGTLAMETLLSLTSKRAGEWFKEDLRKLGGLEHIIKTISDFCRPVIACDLDMERQITWMPQLLDNMQTVARCLRVLENVTQHNEANQRYMLTFAKGRAVDTLCLLYRFCSRQMVLHPSTTELATGSNSRKEHPGVAMRELLINVMKVLISLTHTFNEAHPSLGADLLGKRGDVIETSFHLLLLSSNYIPENCVFELSILVLTLLINLCMYTPRNRTHLMEAFAPADYVADTPPVQGRVSALQALIEYFYKCEELARLVEKNTDAFLESNETGKKKQEEVEETVNNLLQRAGHHMEHTLKGSYAAILVGNLITDNELYEAIVRRQLRGHSFREVLGVLEKYHTFMNLTSSLEANVVSHMKSTKRIIDNFKKRDYIYEHADELDDGLPLNLETTGQDHQDDLGAGISGDTTTSSSTSSSPTSSTRVPRVYKTYSSHR